MRKRICQVGCIALAIVTKSPDYALWRGSTDEYGVSEKRVCRPNNLQYPFSIFLLCLVLLCFSDKSYAQHENFCGISNRSTQSGEKLTYKVYYTLAGAYIGAGEAVFSNTLETLQGKQVYHVVGWGKTYTSYDWFYKVDDVYESYIDTTTMLPLKFTRNVHERNNRIYNNVLFNHTTKKAVSTNGMFNIPACVQDVLSSIYYARNIDYNQYKVGDKIPFSLYLDDQVYNIFIRYLGKQKLKTKTGTYNTIKFKPLLIEGTIFKGGENMNVWVSDDENKVPVLIETPILIGSIKVYLTATDHLKNRSVIQFKK